MNNIDINLDICYETYPCKHPCKITKNNKIEEKILFGTEIFQFLKENNLSIPEHFQGYGSSYFTNRNKTIN